MLGMVVLRSAAVVEFTQYQGYWCWTRRVPVLDVSLGMILYRCWTRRVPVLDVSLGMILYRCWTQPVLVLIHSVRGVLVMNSL